MAEQVADQKKYGSIEDLPKELKSFLCCKLNDNVTKEKLNILCYLFNETLNSMKFPSNLVQELSCQRKLNIHIFIEFISVCGKRDIGNAIEDLLTKEENSVFCAHDLKDKNIIGKELSKSDGFTLSKRSIKFRLLVVDIFLNSDFHQDDVSAIKDAFDLPAVKKEMCVNLLEMFVEAEKQQNVNKTPTDTIKFLIDVVSINGKAVEKIKKFRTDNLHFFS